MTGTPWTLRLEPLGRLWQQAWLVDAAAGGPARFADWLAGLPTDLDAAPGALWRVDLLVADAVSRSGATPVVVAPEPGGRCLAAVSVRVVEVVLARLHERGVDLEESVALLEPVVAELADSDAWPVPTELRARLEALAERLADAVAATGAEVRAVGTLLGVPGEDAAGAAVDLLDLDRAAAACLAVPAAVVASVAAPESSR